MTLSILLSVFIVALLRTQFNDDQVWYIRMQQVFGLLSLVYLYLTLVISPIAYVVGRQRVTRLLFARRAIGVSAFYFALLHTAIVLFGQLGGLDSLGLLPNLFKWSLLGGTIALVILFFMTITSADWVVEKFGFRRWKLMHRTVYIAGLLIILHTWAIGTHLAYGWAQVVGFTAMVVLFGLESYRFIGYINKKYWKLDQTEAFAIAMTVCAIISMSLLALPKVVPNYHSDHVHDSNDKSHRGMH